MDICGLKVSATLSVSVLFVQRATHCAYLPRNQTEPSVHTAQNNYLFIGRYSPNEHHLHQAFQ